MVEVRGFDAAGFLRIAPTDGGAGEALLPASEVGDLRFIFSEAYQEAQLRVSIGRPAEALHLLQRELPAYVPYAVLENSNVPGAVRLYLRLLQQNRQWPEAVAVGASLTGSRDAPALIADVFDLVESLVRVGRIEDASWLLGRISLESNSAYVVDVARIASQLRRSGHWPEARNVYLRLMSQEPQPGATPWSALAAYCAWHLDEPLPAVELVEAHSEQSASAWEGLLGLMRGRVALAMNDPVAALDTLSEALINAPANSEWRLEITTLLATAYAARGDTELAQRMKAELARLYPDSRWILSEPKNH